MTYGSRNPRRLSAFLSQRVSMMTARRSALPCGRSARSWFAVSVVAAVIGGVAFAGAADAAAYTAPKSYLDKVVGSSAHRSVTVSGWAYEPAASTARVTITVLVDRRVAKTVTTGLYRPDVARVMHISGTHSGFSATVSNLSYAKHSICVQASVRSGSATLRKEVGGCHTVTIVRPLTKNQLIAAYAKKFVGHYRYVSGGNSPRKGFDCSGLTQYIYAQYGIKLAHYAPTQAHSFRRTKHPQAGDLVFFTSGGVVYHVGVYEGHGMMVAAATTAQGIRYQTVWSRSVWYGTRTHA